MIGIRGSLDRVEFVDERPFSVTWRYIRSGVPFGYTANQHAVIESA